MSTEYQIAKTDEAELCVLEHSNMFDIYLARNDRDGSDLQLRNLSLEELKAVRDKLTQVIGYFEW